MSLSLKVLAIGAHPDDVEIGAGGTLARFFDEGHQTGLLSMTKAELSSNGTVERRLKEAGAAAEILGCSVCEHLSFPDRNLPTHRESIIEEVTYRIRKYQPEIVLAPWHQDRHPDHGHCGSLVKEAVFNAGIRNYKPDSLSAWKVSDLYYYAINSTEPFHVAYDISAYTTTKRHALEAFSSQFRKEEGTVTTPLNQGFIERIEARDRQTGFECGTEAAEGFYKEGPVLMQSMIRRPL
ncbi:bacillithiol biosynthesis deacetylase BshB1 [Salisediminibacterium selenitireducens]|uniref:LmbE family protein n=1 Tax=Bacillus selenitireducens (strain ATCC 700615 / DSM 15326 / MLS10) TaxID=439292 RepID=D6XUX4_BACIE|nr:bacillithiol biosynthesis deacetylase BshB1 [Salisediminibacterium selenitireducens]ADH99610.1 LmbE family protein [[Bacillus] selenitireducens MLS10]